MNCINAAALLGLISASTWAALGAGPAPAPGPTPGPKNESGLTAALVVGKATYTLSADQSGKEFRDRLQAAQRAGRQLPATPAVDFTLQVKNAGDRNVTLTLGGDQSAINLKLEGPGAVMMQNNMAMTMEFRIGRPTTLAPGQTHEIKISSLTAGHRGITEVAYWTEPGEYTLTATLNYTEGDKQAKVISAPVKVKVEGPK